MENRSKFDVKECVRMTSVVCSSDHQVQALQFLYNDDLRGFTDFVNNEDVEARGEDRGHWINSPVVDDGSTLLEVSINKKREQFVETLLQVGARPDLVSPSSGLAPAHLCVNLADLRLLELVLNPEDRDVNIRSASYKGGLSPLHLASEKGNLEIVNRLLEFEEIDVDIKDNRGVLTPLMLAVKNRHQRVAVTLIENGASLDFKSGRLTVREHLKEAFPGLNPDTVKVKKTRQLHLNIADKIFSLVKETEMNQSNYDIKLIQFKSYLRFVRHSKEENRLDEVFDLTCKKGLHDHAELLLMKGAKINTKTKPILEAAFYGHHTIFKVFMKFHGDFTVTKDVSKESILHIVLQMKSKFADRSSYEKCLDELLNLKHSITFNQMRRIVNKTDQYGNTALHYATQKWPQHTVRRLLELGANIGIKNYWREIPVTKIRPDVLESFLSEFCLTGEGDVNHEDFSMTFCYDFLAPDPEALPEKYKETSTQDYDEGEEDLVQCENNEKTGTGDSVALPETEPLWYMSQSREHRYLLKHPVITSFLWFKWQKIRKYFNRNLRFTVLFVFLLTWTIFKNFGTHQDDTTSRELWFFCYIILFVVQMFFVVKDWFIDIKNYKRNKSIQNSADIPEHSIKVCWNIFISNWIEGVFIALCLIVLIFREYVLEIIVTSLLSMLLVRELMQMAVSLKRYFSSTENWVEIAILILTSILLIPGFYEDSFEVKRHLAAFAIVLAWAELIVLLGQHPKLREYNIYVTMFFKVMKTFLLFLTWYFLFIIAFGLGFYILLHKTSSKLTSGGQSGEEVYKFFDTVWLSLVKTATMLAGELEFSDIPIDLDSHLAPLAYCFFLTFVFLIVIVLFNLLNGLAVSDTGIIRDKAEIYSYKSQVETISTFESMLLGDPFDFLSNVPSRLSGLPSCSLLQQFYSNSLLRQAFTKLGASEILLFYKYLKTKSVTLTPNRREDDCCCLR